MLDPEQCKPGTLVVYTPDTGSSSNAEIVYLVNNRSAMIRFSWSGIMIASLSKLSLQEAGPSPHTFKPERVRYAVKDGRVVRVHSVKVEE